MKAEKAEKAKLVKAVRAAKANKPKKAGPPKKRGRKMGHTAGFMQFKRATELEHDARGSPMPLDDLLMMQYKNNQALGGNFSDTSSFTSGMTDEDDRDEILLASGYVGVGGMGGMGGNGVGGVGMGGVGMGGNGMGGVGIMPPDWDISLDGLVLGAVDKTSSRLRSAEVQAILDLGGRYDSGRVPLAREEPFPTTSNTITDQFTTAFAVSCYISSNQCKPSFVERFLYRNIEETQIPAPLRIFPV